MKRIFAEQHKDHFVVQVGAVACAGAGQYEDMTAYERKEFARKLMLDNAALMEAWEGKALWLTDERKCGRATSVRLKPRTTLNA